MILTGPEIERAVSLRALTISPFSTRQLNPNSYNYRLSPIIRVSEERSFDARATHSWSTIQIPPKGLVLEPRRLYLGCTVETIGSLCYVPSLIGRSSLGRLGMFLQISADLGNLGKPHCWTLEITVVQRLRIYPGMVVGQVAFWCPEGSVMPYAGRYHDFSHAMPSLRGDQYHAIEPSEDL